MQGRAPKGDQRGVSHWRLHDHEPGRHGDRRSEALRVAVPYRDVAPGVKNLNLSVSVRCYLIWLREDCWRGLYRAKQHSCVDFSPGGFDYDEYSRLDCPLNADLHEIVHGKLVAMRGPKDLVSVQLWQDVYQDGQFKRFKQGTVLRPQGKMCELRTRASRPPASWASPGPRPTPPHQFLFRVTSGLSGPENGNHAGIEAVKKRLARPLASLPRKQLLLAMRPGPAAAVCGREKRRKRLSSCPSLYPLRIRFASIV